MSPAPPPRTLKTTDSAALVHITLNAVLATLEEGEPKVLCTITDTSTADAAMMALPCGPFDPSCHRTFEVGLRDWVTRQTNVSIGYVEQLYTFGDRGREVAGAGHLYGRENPGADTRSIDHIVSVGYLAMAPDPAAVDGAGARWRNWYRFFPWEDWRAGEPAILARNILPALFSWADTASDPHGASQRHARIRLAFGFSDIGWEEERVLERYEIMYEAGLVAEAPRVPEGRSETITAPDAHIFGLSMASDHRRILATAIARLRGKLKYRPIIFELIAEEFTLFDLQKRVEAIIGFKMHKQNFRRAVENSSQVERSGNMSSDTGGRPAALFTVNHDDLKDRAAKGLVIPRLKRSPAYGARRPAP